jgi:hypothetical protein
MRGCSALRCDPGASGDNRQKVGECSPQGGNGSWKPNRCQAVSPQRAIEMGAATDRTTIEHRLRFVLANSRQRIQLWKAVTVRSERSVGTCRAWRQQRPRPTRPRYAPTWSSCTSSCWISRARTIVMRLLAVGPAGTSRHRSRAGSDARGGESRFAPVE